MQKLVGYMGTVHKYQNWKANDNLLTPNKKKVHQALAWIVNVN